MTDHDFFAAMAVGIPPIKPPEAPAPVWLGVDLATGPDKHIEVGRAADGTFYIIPEEQSPMTQLKAFCVDDMPTYYAAETAQQAAELYEADCGDVPADGYPYEATDKELASLIEITDEDENPTGEFITIRDELATASPGLLCGAE